MRIFQVALLLSLITAPAFARTPDSKVEPTPQQNPAALKSWIAAHPKPDVPPNPDMSRTDAERR